MMSLPWAGYRGRHRKTGKSFAVRTVHIWTVRLDRIRASNNLRTPSCWPKPCAEPYRERCSAVSLPDQGVLSSRASLGDIP